MKNYRSISKEEDLFDSFKKNKEAFFEQSIVISFFLNKKNEILLKKFLVTNEKRYSDELDLEFRKHYKKARIVKYISNLSYFYSIDFDKKQRAHNERYLTILSDFSKNEDSDTTNPTIDYFTQNSNDVVEEVITLKNYSLQDQLEDKILYQALNKLNPKQKEVLELIYNHNFKLKEIAKLKDKSPQSISQLHKYTLKKIRKEILALEDGREGEIYETGT